MSAQTASIDVDATVSPRTFRLLALGSVLALTASYVSVLQDVTAIVGGTRTLLAVVVAMLAAATLLATVIGVRTATAAAVGAAVVGFWYYLQVVGLDVGVALAASDRFLSDTIALATGLPITRTVEAGVWTLGFAPAPVFLSWYLALRRRYVLAVVAGGLALGFLVLTGDATPGVTLVGTLGGIAAVGFGELERRHGTIAQADVLAMLFAVVIVLSLSVTLVPSGAAGPAFLVETGHDGTLEGSLTAAPDRSAIGGSVDLSPEVRFTVRSEEPAYWRVGVYDRFTGGDWLRTGQTRGYEDGLPSPPGDAERVKQTVFVEERGAVMPAAPHPVEVEGEAAANTRVTAHGQIRPDDPLIEGDAYNVYSAVLDDSPEALRGAGTDYPGTVEDRYLQTPESLSTEFERRASEIVGDREDPYEKAAAIESHLRDAKDYSLDVDRPSGNVAEEFVTGMDEGYCVYFATAMVQLLRAEDVPSRYAVGYTTGQQVDDNEWVVRGLNAHAWVEVYFPDHGWVSFDPTPGGPREDVRTDRIADARASGVDGVDVEESEDVPVANDSPGDRELEVIDPEDDNETPGNDTGLGDPGGSSDGPPGAAPPPEIDPGGEGSAGTPDRNDSSATGDDGTDGPGLPAENALLGVAALVGLAAGARRTGATTRARRAVRIRWHGFRSEPDRDAERAFRRLELLLERRYRPRKRSESPRAYVGTLSRAHDVDPRADAIRRTYERAVYGDGVDREEADAAIEAVDGMAREATPLLGRFRT